MLPPFHDRPTVRFSGTYRSDGSRPPLPPLRAIGHRFCSIRLMEGTAGGGRVEFCIQTGSGSRNTHGMPPPPSIVGPVSDEHGWTWHGQIIFSFSAGPFNNTNGSRNTRSENNKHNDRYYSFYFIIFLPAEYGNRSCLVCRSSSLSL